MIFSLLSFFLDFFEFYVNDKIVFSKHYLGHFPNQEEMVQVSWCECVRVTHEESIRHLPAHAR